MSRSDPKIRLALFLLVFFALWSIRAVWLIQADRTIQSPEARSVFSAFVKALLWIVPAASFGYWTRRENPLRYLGLSAIPRWGITIFSSIAIGLFCLLVLLFETQFGQKRVVFRDLSLAGIPSAIAFFLVSPLVEEIFFRGLVLKEMTAFLKPVSSNLVTSLLFVGIHLPYWISSGVQFQDGARMSAGIFLFSLFAGWLYSISKSIWPPTVAHIANNVISSLLYPGKQGE